MAPDPIALGEIPFFRSLGATELDALRAAMVPAAYAPNVLILKRDEVGDSMFVIESGEVLIYLVDDAGQRIELVVLGPGESFGEQALRSGEQSRNAWAEALSQVSLWQLRKADFERVVADPATVEQALGTLREAQIRNHLLQQNALLRAIRNEEVKVEREVFTDGEVVFRQGDEGDRFYGIVSGQVRIEEESGDVPVVLSTLGPGQVFGELALLEDEPRSATAVVSGRTEVASLDRSAFLRLAGENRELSAMLQSLRHLYTVAGKYAATIHPGKLMDFDCMTCIVHMDGGIRLVSQKVVGQPIFHLARLENADVRVRTVSYDCGETSTHRQLLLSKVNLLGVVAHGEWPELGRIYELALRARALRPDEIRRFRKTGHLWENLEAEGGPAVMVCTCLRLTRARLTEAAQECETAATLAARTGAGTICGACARDLVPIVERVIAGQDP